ncbi:hypothetical protein [Campylobacter concisus]|uniref:hypothetical protein n=1 Tax=Campylobacter concisus TaxID=199 RepID=UPI001CA4FFC5|nr:hypothetical protein [Campylobacter concisus]
MPITEAGTHEKVAALVYLLDTLPDNGECAAEALERQNALMKGLSPYANGEIILPVKPRFSSASNAYECSCI